MAIAQIATIIFIYIISILSESRSDTNHVYSPCSDSKIQRSDGFTFGIAFSTKNSFYPDNNSSRVQLSPCDKRLSLSNSQIAVFRPKVDQISLLTINTSSFFPVMILLCFCVLLCEFVFSVGGLVGSVVVFGSIFREVEVRVLVDLVI